MTDLRDSLDRKRALTELDKTWLVEAAAGTGKTSLLAGRVTMLLASGVQPRNIAAITFTEPAAAELRFRVDRFVDELLADKVPEDLELAVTDKLSPLQKAALLAARDCLDELTATTIHGFCHGLLRQYSIEAGVDPGATILDAVQSDLAFNSVFARWLQRRLGEGADPLDPVAVMAQHDPAEAVDTLKLLGKFRREYLTAQPIAFEVPPHAEQEFVEAVSSFRRWMNGVIKSDDLAADVADLETIVSFYQGAFDERPSFSKLWKLAHPPRVNLMLRRSFELRKYRRLEAWQQVAGDSEGQRLADAAAACYAPCAEAFRSLLGGIATELVAKFSHSIDDLLEDFTRFKRHAAVLDFDDLLRATRRLLTDNEEVRRAASERYLRLLVDETQDTDPVQAEIVFRIASTSKPSPSWQTRQMIPGALFLVGDPRQSIFRFRSADVSTYMEAKNALETQFPDNVLRITTSFRSREDILTYVNRQFTEPLGRQAPGYVALDSSLGPPEHGLPCVMTAKVAINDSSSADFVRDQEAKLVADICSRLVGNVRVRRSNREVGPARPGDIALLAPVGTDLWRYERSLEELGLPVLSQAGRNLFRRQEAQDFVALVRTLADPADRLALGALLRGPLCGLTEQELLDITLELAEPISLGAPSERISNPTARETIQTLQTLARRAAGTQPYLLLAAAIDRLRVRAKLAARGSDQANRSLGNLDLLMDRARRYSVRGLQQFALDISADWQGGKLGPVPYEEARLDADGSAINLVTMHSSKGIEWPIVIPINLVSLLKRRDEFIYRRRDDTLHWVLGDVMPPAMIEAIATEDRESAEERERLLYVASTRAMEMLIIPQYSVRRPDNTWSEVLQLVPEGTPEWHDGMLPRGTLPPPPDETNTQTREVFDREEQAVKASSPTVKWRRPSDEDSDRTVSDAILTDAGSDLGITSSDVAGSSLRGSVLHKLVEEVLTGETPEDQGTLERRAELLIRQLETVSKANPPSAGELASTVLRTFAIPDIARHRASLLSEVGIFSANASGEVMVAGRADAVAMVDGKPVVFDWKSDVAPDQAARQKYRGQLLDYMQSIGATRGALVFMTPGTVEWIERHEPRDSG